MDYKLIQTIIKDFETSSLTSMELETSDFKIKLQKDTITKKEEKSTAKVQEEKTTGYPVTSPLVGTFYSAPSPKEKPFVRVGQKVNAGDTLCIIEAMKIMNEIESPISGIVSEIKVSNNEAVGIDQVLMIIEPM
ncbi:MAG TPA: acetyl-CoA carboxylase, biotin carboxyl carrier protein [Acholeplasmataceae bacterium]|jgi:acetyl-CoA carboxylase biotin carboxyl carrier protein|nr:acetyl-CoA carboxylase, biotin carboxyl carrier protein [Acholeplasmataceae bacterium]